MSKFKQLFDRLQGEMKEPTMAEAVAEFAAHMKECEAAVADAIALSDRACTALGIDLTKDPQIVEGVRASMKERSIAQLILETLTKVRDGELVPKAVSHE